MSLRTSFSLIGVLIASVIWFKTFKATESLEKQNKSDFRGNDNTWGKGLEAEETVGKSLKKLSQEFKVIDDFNTGHRNIDFIIVGPTGIFTIEVKATKGFIGYKNGRVLINNSTNDFFLIQTEAERFWLTQRLKQHFNKDYLVIGLLEFPNSVVDKTTINGPVKANIWIGERNFHKYLIENSRNYLTAEEITSIFSFLSSEKKK